MSGAIPYFGDAYMADTRHLTLEEHGAYHLLILIAWRSPHCALPDDDRRLAQMLGITPKRWARLKPTVMAFWHLTEHGWQQKRLSKERRWVAEKSSQSRAAAKASHGPKSLRHKSRPPANADTQPCGTACEKPAPLPTTLPTGVTSPNGEVPETPSFELELQGEEQEEEKPLTPEEVVEAWNQRMVPRGFPRVLKLTPTRLSQVKARIREYGIEDWRKAMSALERSSFLRGDNGRGYRADFDFLIQPRSFIKLLEGSYDH